MDQSQLDCDLQDERLPDIYLVFSWVSLQSLKIEILFFQDHNINKILDSVPIDETSVHDWAMSV